MSEAQGQEPFDRRMGLIALDWGTSSLRAWRLSETGAVLQFRQQGWGIMHLPEGGFAAAFAAITHDWMQPGEAVAAIACGMVGSRQGWREAPYVPTPAGLEQLSANLLTLEAGPGIKLHLVPGVLETNDPLAPDVMRGEETQAMGAAGRLGGDALLVMPGTHSKWARLRGEALNSFRTMMTGELFALLRQHSILGRGQAEAPAVTQDAKDAAFRSGVLAGQTHGASARLFSTRALTLTGQLELGCALDYLSGLLIGEELRAAAPDLASAARIAITGDAALCERYARAFTLVGAAEPERIPDTALDGLLRIATRAGLLPASASDGAA
jgi:2-dehydro-3-deoxygalactonokinase